MSAQAEYKRHVLGTGIIAPFHRVSSDFDYASGEQLVKSAIAQILRTRPGELPWRPEFGIDLERYRHRAAVGPLAQEIGALVSGAISYWDNRIKVSRCEVGIDGNLISVKVSWTAGNENEQGSSVLISTSQEVKI